MLQIAGYNGDNVAQSSEDSSDGRTGRQNVSASRPTDKVPTVMLKSRNVDGVGSTSSNNVTQSIPGMLAGDSSLQPQIHQLHSSTQPSSGSGSSSSSASCMY